MAKTQLTRPVGGKLGKTIENMDFKTAFTVQESHSKTLFFSLSRWIPFFIGLALIALDIGSKWMTQHYLPLMNHRMYIYPYQGIAIFENILGIEFSIVHAINRGAAWGVLAEYQQMLLLLRIAFIIGMGTYLIFFNQERKSTIPLTLILAGATGNVLDYFCYGHVVDMFHFVLWGYDYPVFNVADSSIFLGASAMIFLRIFYRQVPEH